MKIKFKNKNKRLWNQSPCTLRNAIQNTIMDKSSRFCYGSIYFKDEVDKPKKVFTELERPEIVLINFRRQIDDITLRTQKAAKNRTLSSKTSFERKVKPKISFNQTEIRFYKRPQKLELRYDRFGNRSTFLGEYNIKDLKSRVRESRRNFYSSSRVDLSKPINFYPGPGSYFMDRDIKMKQVRNTYTERTISKVRSASLNK